MAKPLPRYTLLLDPDEEEGGYTVAVPALPGVVTQGETVEECQERAREAIALHIEGRRCPVRLAERRLPDPCSTWSA